MSFEGFISTEEMAALKAKEEEDKIDREWAEKISTVPLGAGWRMTRPDDESQRNFKRRINAAAFVSFRLLDWIPQETNLPKGQDPKHYVVRVKSFDITAKNAAEAASRQNGPKESPQTTVEPDSTQGSQETTQTPPGRRR